MAAFVEAALPQVEARFPGNRAVAFGHLGDGNVHFHVLAPKGGGPRRMGRSAKARRSAASCTTW
jgi:FAD/FMN-containing dehydrogenase